MARMTGRAVLVVEDEYYLAADLEQLLRREGAEVLGPFVDQRGALAQLVRKRPDCAVLDVKLGRGESFDLAQKLQDLGVPFLFFTGYDQEMIPERFSTITRLEKPVDNVRLLDSVAALCDKQSG